ncbi:hypothetical protein [Flavihumibacter petaseus]|uniref:Uncharacterized protein n=1 Tax=Flavihumibacter petaseus NBRC 106054 TaxID=1220578 RepID=A0A0E9N3F8_9BACT|nr:hypothetical protein [Flavihumibacter petaseus]GAO44338.1 hypothetical protein FPE01S_03_03760 [Flavihumibacter petaseus NBRC 106054]
MKHMFTDDEKRFMAYWEQNRDKQKKVFRQWLVGLPMGLVIVIPIVISYVTGWHKRAVMVAGSQFNPMVLIIALLAIVTFTAIFYKQHQWDQYDQKYRELKARESAGKNETGNNQA